MYRLILCLILILIFFIIINMLYKTTNNYINEMNQIKKFQNGVPQNLDIVNLGSTYAKYAFFYNNIGVRGFNFALKPQSLNYDYKILSQYQNNLKKGCIVLITLPEFIYCFEDYKDDNRNTKYYYFLDKNYILKYNFFKFILKKYFPLLFSPKSAIRLFKDKRLENEEQEYNKLSKEEVEKEAKRRVTEWKKEFRLFSFDSNRELPDEIKENMIKTRKILGKIIQLCREKEFIPVCIIPPVTTELNSELPMDFLNKILYSNIIASKDNTLVLDYLKDEEFQDYNLYINSDILNFKGRKKFTKRVIEDLRKNGIYLNGEKNEN